MIIFYNIVLIIRCIKINTIRVICYKYFVTFWIYVDIRKRCTFYKLSLIIISLIIIFNIDIMYIDFTNYFKSSLYIFYYILEI